MPPWAPRTFPGMTGPLHDIVDALLAEHAIPKVAKFPASRACIEGPLLDRHGVARRALLKLLASDLGWPAAAVREVMHASRDELSRAVADERGRGAAGRPSKLYLDLRDSVLARRTGDAAA